MSYLKQNILHKAQKKIIYILPYVAIWHLASFCGSEGEIWFDLAMWQIYADTNMHFRCLAVKIQIKSHRYMMK